MGEPAVGKPARQRVRLSRSTDGQLKESNRIARRNLREGDLVFFTSRASRKHEEKDALRDKYSLVRCGERELAEISPDAVVGVRKNAFGAEALCLSREIALRHPRLTAERPTIEEIMLFFTKDAVDHPTGGRR